MTIDLVRDMGGTLTLDFPTTWVVLLVALVVLLYGGRVILGATGGRMSIAVFSESVTVARSAPPAGAVFVALFGDTTVDVSRVPLPESSRWTAVSAFGDVTFVVPPGTAVEFDGLALLGDQTFTPRREPDGRQHQPVVQVTGIALIGDLEVVEAEN